MTGIEHACVSVGAGVGSCGVADGIGDDVYVGVGGGVVVLYVIMMLLLL